jgi:hypothetical protein
MTNEEKEKFNKYWKVGFKYLFLTFFIIVTARVAFVIAAESQESMTIGSILLAYSIITLGSLGLSLLVAFMAIQKERE